MVWASPRCWLVLDCFMLWHLTELYLAKFQAMINPFLVFIFQLFYSENPLFSKLLQNHL